MTSSPLRRHGARGSRVAVGAAITGLLVAGTVVAPWGTDASIAVDSPTVPITGHGWGHGRGMGQYGALGYALDYGWTYGQIVAHYYGGTTLEAAAPNQVIRVELTARQGMDAIITGSQLKLYGSAVTGAALSPDVTAVLVHKTSPTTVQVSTTTTPQSGNPCGGPWTPSGQDLTATALGSVIVGTTADTTQYGGMMRLCQADGTETAYRGEFESVLGASGTQYLLNRVFSEDYLRGVVPRESPASWGDLGNGAGMNALEAQAVAARSYALASYRPSSGATTCDTTACQVYGGAAKFSASGTQTSVLEDSRSDTAVAATAGQVMVNAGGGIARTEFSSSTGGYTAGGTFPAVVDLGDSRSPYHNWSVTMSLSTIAADLGTGPISQITVTARNGLGQDGGRATTVTASLQSGGTRTFTGAQVQAALGLRSDWFTFGTQDCTSPGGYWMATAKGSVYGKCAAGYFGSANGAPLNNPIVTMAPTPSSQGYWLVASDGGVFAYGDAAFYGSTGAIRLNKPIVTAMATPSGHGYWLVASDGGVFSFGDAAFYGSTGAIRLNKPIVAAMATPSGHGYWLVASDGGVFSFGDAAFYGSTGAIRLNKPIVTGMATPSGRGYWMVASDGGVFCFGDAQFYGSTGAITLNKPIVAAAADASGNGYWMFATDGGVFAFGDAPFLGSLGGTALDSPVVTAARA